MKALRIIKSLAVVVLCSLCGCGRETESEAMARMMKEAEGTAAAHCSNDVVGFTRVVKVDFDYHFSAPEQKDNEAGWKPLPWTAEVVAEHVNAVGGAERTNLCYNFGIYHGAKGEQLMCMLDDREMARREYAAWPQEFERLHPGELARYGLTNAAAGK
jgi:hypothetical protein